MSKSTGDNLGGISVRIFRVANRLKKKLGVRPLWAEKEPGYIDPKAVTEGEALIRERCKKCPEAIAHFLEKLTTAWSVMRDMPESPERQALSREIFTLSHEIKDIGALCGYDLASYFAESLRDYIEQTELNLQAQRVIIQAHIDALTVVSRQGLKTDGGDAAEELKHMVKIAIEKYR
ncbi:MAG: hypothetical protein KDJ15_01775 [Alphaproteobacteria bacterium]|nr:hypothetical protein [Alphaproteobacteria bacterium]